MKQIHATTSSFKTYVRMLVLLILSVVFVLTIPYIQTSAMGSILSAGISNAGMLFAIILGFLLYITLIRKHGLEQAVSLELNKTRRIYHMAYNMALAEPKLEAWFKELRSALEAYHRQFRTLDFDHYDEGDKLFRRVTYAVYGLPQTKLPYSPDLYGSLLGATSSATEARETINSIKDSRLGRFSWLIMLLITFVFCLMLVFYTPLAFTPRAICGVIIFSLLLTLQLLFEYDHFNTIKHRYISDIYAENIEKAERLPEDLGSVMAYKKINGKKK